MVRGRDMVRTGMLLKYVDPGTCLGKVTLLEVHNNSTSGHY